ncbi:MAG: class I SAM-dependent methyltransferase, partial [Bacteroidetes bacterium]|nr:class I SAM-dependent methyltransferase [Bacteroidota bacterium]
DLGCGVGEASVYFALKGAQVTACDVSVECLKLAKNISQEFKVNIHTVKMRAETLGFPDETFMPRF